MNEAVREFFKGVNKALSFGMEGMTGGIIVGLKIAGFVVALMVLLLILSGKRLTADDVPFLKEIGLDLMRIIVSVALGFFAMGCIALLYLDWKHKHDK